MTDFYAKCEQGVCDLLQAIGPESTDYNYALTLQVRLAEVLSRIRGYGPTESRAAELAEILERLNCLCQDNLNRSFNNLATIDSPLGAPSTKVCHNLPHPDYIRFVGRERELQMIREWLLPTSGHSIIVIEGIGGIGKSSLALEAARHYVADYADLALEERFGAVVWTSAKQTALTAHGEQPALDPQRNLSRIYATISMCLEREDIIRADSESQHELVRRALGRQRTLLIIDNLETMEDEQVLSFLDKIPLGTNAIVTTRTAISNWPARLRLDPLTKPDIYDLLRIWPEARIHLTDSHVDRLLRYLGGIPLAMKLCFSLADSGEDLESVMAELTQPANRANVVSFCLDSSWRSLAQKSEEACDFVRVLALFDSMSGATAEMIAFLLGVNEAEKAIPPLWREIARLSLAAKTAAGRYRLLPLVQLHAARQWKESTVHEWRLKQLQYYMRRLLGSYIVHVDFVCGDETTQEHTDEIDNLGIVFEWCQKEPNLAPELLQFADGFSTLLYLVGHVNRAIEVAGIGRETAQRLGHRERQYDFCCKLSLYHTWSDRFDRASFFLEEARALSLQVPNYRPDNVLEYTGSFLMRRRGHAQVLQAYEPLCQSTSIREAFDAADKDRRVAVLGRFMMGVWFYRATAELKDNPTVGQNSAFRRDLLEKLGMPQDYSEEQAAQDLLAKAREWLMQGLSLATEITFHRGRAYILNYLGNVCCQQQQYAEAEQRLIESLEIAERLQDRRRIARVQQSLFHLCTRQGRFGEAHTWAEKAIDGFEKLGMREAKEVQDELNRFEDQARGVS